MNFDSPAWKVAAARAVITAVVAGALSFFAVWQSTDDVKVLVTAGLTPFLTVIGARWGLEGYIDSHPVPLGAVDLSRRACVDCGRAEVALTPGDPARCFDCENAL